MSATQVGALLACGLNSRVTLSLMCLENKAEDFQSCILIKESGDVFQGKVMTVFFNLCRTLPVSYNRKNCRRKKSVRSTTQNPRDTRCMKIAIIQKMEVSSSFIKCQDHGIIGEPGDLAAQLGRFPLLAFSTVALHKFPGPGSNFILESGTTWKNTITEGTGKSQLFLRNAASVQRRNADTILHLEQFLFECVCSSVMLALVRAQRNKCWFMEQPFKNNFLQVCIQALKLAQLL